MGRDLAQADDGTDRPDAREHGDSQRLRLGRHAHRTGARFIIAAKAKRTDRWRVEVK